MGLFVCNRLILQARPHKLNKRGNWVLIKSQEWGCVKDTTTPTDTGVKSVWLISQAKQPPGPGRPSLEPFDVWLEGKSFPLHWLASWRAVRREMTLSSCQPQPPHLSWGFKQERHDCFPAPFASVHIWLGNTDGWPVAQLVEKVRNSFPATYVFHGVDLKSYSRPHTLIAKVLD